MVIPSILTSIKNSLGIPEEEVSFDEVVLMHVNSVFNILGQLGFRTDFSITDDTAVWSDYYLDEPYVPSIKTFMQANVRLWFDPPQNSFLVTAIERQIEMLTWRLSTYIETKEVVLDEDVT